MVIGVAEYERSHTGTPTPTDGMIAILGGAAFLLAVAGVSLAVRNACRNSRLIRHPVRQKEEPQRSADDCTAGLRTAHDLAAQILVCRRLAPLTVWGLLLRPGGTAYFDLTGSRSRSVLSPHGHPRSSEPQPVRIIATSERMLCDTGTTWRSLWYHDVVGLGTVDLSVFLA